MKDDNLYDSYRSGDGMFKILNNASDFISRRSGSITIEMGLEPAMGG